MTDFNAISAILKEQREAKPKPKIEDYIPRYLDNNMKNIALDFAAFLQDNKMRLSWAGMANAWKANCKSKCICYVRLCLGYASDRKVAKWVITLYLDHMNLYQKAIINEKMQNTIWDNIKHCIKCFPEKYPEGRPCFPGKNMMILEKEIKGICQSGSPFWFWDPDEKTIKCIKRLLELEQKARIGDIKK